MNGGDAGALVTREFVERGIDRVIPMVNWVPTDTIDIDGEYDPDTNIITIWAGTHTEAYLAATLHEIAHAIRGDGYHNDEFYDVARELYIKYSIPFELAKEMEGIIPGSWFNEKRW